MKLLTKLGKYTTSNKNMGEARIMPTRIGLEKDYSEQLEYEGFTYLALGYDKKNCLSLIFSKIPHPGFYSIYEAYDGYRYISVPRKKREEMKKFKGEYRVTKTYKEDSFYVLNIVPEEMYNRPVKRLF